MNRTPNKVLPADGRAHNDGPGPEEWVRILQGKLGNAAKVDPKRRFHTLIDKVYNPRTLMAAWKKVRANRGAAGVDRRTIAEIELAGPQKYLERLSKDLQNGTYKIKGVRRAYVPKADGGERPLGIPTVSPDYKLCS
jgi:retron-type reverse transcriptase